MQSQKIPLDVKLKTCRWLLVIAPLACINTVHTVVYSWYSIRLYTNCDSVVFSQIEHCYVMLAASRGVSLTASQSSLLNCKQTVDRKCSNLSHLTKRATVTNCSYS